MKKIAANRNYRLTKRANLISQAPDVVKNLVSLLNNNGYQASVSDIENNEYRQVYKARVYFSIDDEDGDEWRSEIEMFTGASKGFDR